MGNLILPDDPDFHQPLIMGDPYAQALPPKLAHERRVQEMDAQREKDGAIFKYANSMIAYGPEPAIKLAQASGSNIMTNPMFFSPLHTPQNWQTPSKRRETYMWARHYYDNDPKVAAAIDFYSRFSMNNFILECHDRKILNFFKYKVADRLRMNENFKMISSEYFLLGDVIIHKEVQCPVCNGTAIDPDTHEVCNHRGGTFKRLIILNPDWIEIQQSVMSDEPIIALIPDEEMKRIVFLRQPKAIYDRIPDNMKRLIMSNQPIPLSSRTTSHLKHMPVPYGTYGTSLVRRLFTTLAYKTKLMTANWIVAERLILPVRVVKIGSDQRPATSTDIADVQQQLAAVTNEPNVTIVTHHSFDYEFYGASGKILQVTQEMEYIGKEILDGFMLNQSLLNGEMSGYQCHDVEQTEVMTSDGFKKFDDITEKDLIATFNPETECIEMHPYTARHEYDYDGEMMHFTGKKIDCFVTPNHKMLVRDVEQKWKAITASEVTANHRFRSVSGWDREAKNIQKISYKGRVFCFTVPNGFFVTRRNGKITIQGNSAQVGVETLIRRIEAWRSTLAEWGEQEVFKPISEMQGFVDEKKSAEIDELCFTIPNIKWNDLDLKDKTQYWQLLMQMHDKGVISTQTLCEEMDINYNQEIKRIRYEQTQVGPAGGGLGGPGGGMGGGGGGLGGAPGGGAPGGDMGMGGGLGGGMGGAPGGDMGMGGGGGGMGGGAPGGAPGGGMAASGGKILKKGKAGSKQDEQEMPVMQPTLLTTIEQEMAQMLQKVANNLGWSQQQTFDNIRIQFPVENPSGAKHFTLDFAIPRLKICFEADGEIAHGSPEQIAHDRERDNLLAQRGWTVLRFDDKIIDSQPQNVEATMYQYIKKLLDKQQGGHEKTSSIVDGELEKAHLFTCIGEKVIDLYGEYEKYAKQMYTERIGDDL